MNILGVGYVRKCDERHGFICQYWGKPQETKDKISKVPQKLYGEFQSLRKQRQLHRKENPPYRYNNALLILVLADKTL